MDISFERSASGKDEWLTPPEIIQALSPIDLDPCAPTNRPWEIAENHYTIMDNGLTKDWRGFVFCNPPYGNKTGLWLSRMSEHGNGVALVFARTDTKNFHQYVFNKAAAILFMEGRLTFYHADGRRGANNAGAPSCLIAYGDEAAQRLNKSGVKGAFIWL